MMDTRKIAVGAAAAAALIVVGGAAIAAGPATETTADETKQEEPSYKGSIQAPSDAERDGTTEDAKGSENEAAEEQQLQSLAKIDRSQAEQTALEEVPGTVKEAELDDENGYVVWEIEVAADGGSYWDVEVDAGNGRILAQEAEDNEGSAQDDKDEANEAAEAPDE